MPKALVSLGGERGFLELASYGRRGPGRRERFSLAQIGLIARTVHRAPEVMVKVLTHGGKDRKAVRGHLRYLSRNGEVELETDDGQRVSGKGAAQSVIENWDLDLDELRPSADLRRAGTRPPPKLVHKLIFSMPPGTPPGKVLDAVRMLAREEFALKHRYVLALHTDEPHPHVHVVVKAMGEDGTRLNIRKDTLRTWRREFARHLRERGVAANATDRAVRGVTRTPKNDGIFRAHERGASTHMRSRIAAVRYELDRGVLSVEPGQDRLVTTRREILKGWAAVAQTLEAQQELELATAVRRFARELPPPMTDKEHLAAQLSARSARTPEDPPRTR